MQLTSEGENLLVGGVLKVRLTAFVSGSAALSQAIQ